MASGQPPINHEDLGEGLPQTTAAGINSSLPRRTFLGGTATLALTTLISETAFAEQPPPPKGYPAPRPPAPQRPQPPSPPPIPRLTAQLGHSGYVLSVCFSPDGRFILTGSYDKTACLWDTATGTALRIFEGHTGQVASVCFSPDGQYALTGSWDKTARLWDVATGKELRSFQGHVFSVRSVCFSLDGRFVLTGSEDLTARLWNVATGKVIRTFQRHLVATVSACFSPDGRFVLTGDDDSKACLWEAATGKVIRTFEGHGDGVTSVCFSPDGHFVLTGSKDNTARLWAVSTGKVIRIFEGHSAAVVSACFSPDSRVVLTGSLDKTGRLWDAATGKLIRSFTGHTNSIASACFSPDGRFVLTGSHDKTARLWDTTSGKELRNFEGNSDTVASVFYSSDGKFMITGSRGKTAHLWDISAGKVIQNFKGHSAAVMSACLSSDSRFALTGSEDKTACLWDTATGSAIRRFEGHSASVVAVCFSPDNRLVLTGSWDLTARLWDISTGKELQNFKGHLFSCASVCFSPDGHFVLTGSHDNTARLWDAATGATIRTLEGHTSIVTSACFSPDGRFALTGSQDKTARLWDVSTGKIIRSLIGHTGGVISVCVSPDGRFALTGSWDRTIRLWDISTGELLRTIQGHSSNVTSVCFSPDGRFVLSGSYDATTRLWDTATGRELNALISFRDDTWAVTTTEGRFDASNDGNVNGLHWVVGMEPIELAQLKAGFYEPGLLARVWKGLPPPFPTPDFTRATIRLYPAVAVTDPKPGERSINIRLTNRGGGIGKVRVWIDGALLTEDARPEALRSNPNIPKAVVTVSLAAVPALKAGQKRTIRVEAENISRDITIRSRGVEASYLPDPATAPTEPPHLYALVFGVSDYADPTLRLKYATKDATDFADALTLAAGTLFTPTRTHITVLTSAGTDPTKKSTRANIAAAFEQVRKQAKATDILVVYGAGHGASFRLPGTNEDLYCYLTQDAHTAHPADLQNAALRRTCAITSADLAGWLNAATGIKTNKKVIILDTCAAGAASATLIAAARELTPEEVARARAIGELHDRTAFHILMGCAADRVSYEAGEYGQGLLTYALLEGMAKSERFIEVPGIFEAVERRVPELAKGIGGIQKPQVASPKGSSIQIGEMQADGRAKIHLPSRKVRILAPAFQDRDKARDTLHLTEKVKLRLANTSTADATTAPRGAKSLYVGEGELPGAIAPSGNYTLAGDTATVRVVLTRDDKEVADFTVTAPTDPEKCADAVAKAILEACEKITP